MRPSTRSFGGRPWSPMLFWLLLTTGANLQPLLRAGPLLTAGITTVGTNVYPYTNKPVTGSQINWSRSLSANLVSAVPLNEGSGTNFYDAVSQQSYSAKTLSGTPTGATPPTWFSPTLSSTYPWAGAAISNNGAMAQAIQSSFQELALITNTRPGLRRHRILVHLSVRCFAAKSISRSRNF